MTLQDLTIDGLFAVTDLAGLSGFAATTLMEVYGNINLFALPTTAGKNELVTALRGQHKPELNMLLHDGETFVNIVVGCDPGNYDSPLAIAPGDHRQAWHTITDQYRRRIVTYEAAIPTITSFDDLFNALTELHRPLTPDTSESPTSQ